MMSYKDMTFCMAYCVTTGCDRHRSKVPSPDKLPGWMPVAWADFSYGCPDYQPEPDKADGEHPL